MRHVTPYTFIEKAIKATIVATEGKSDYISYIDNIVEAIKPLIKSKEGICLTADQYSKLRSSITLQDEEAKTFMFSTISKAQKKNEYHLIYNEALIGKFEECQNFSEEERRKARDDFKIKFEKYINYGIKYLTEEILDPKDVNTITITCEGIARIILTLFNQDQYAAFPEEGNSLLEEIRLYETKDDAQQAAKLKLEKQRYTVKSHNEITKEDMSKYDSCIRIVDNEGSIVKKTVKALYIINSLISSKFYNIFTIENTQEQEQYNTKYNFNIKINNIKINDVDIAKYNQAIDFHNNLHDVFQHHAAKYLYAVFDFKPLEAKVLAPKQRDDTTIIKVYPSASGERKSEYSVQDGIQYRTSEVNGAKGYNDAAIFRSEMSSQDTKDVLQKKIINHIIISLMPFKAIKIGCTHNTNQEGIKKILNSFVELVQKDYNGSKDYIGKEINLDDTWAKQITDEYVRYSESINLSGISEPISDNYDI
ncbi:hypothetical protein [Rickettsia endosymbiont of Culicoides newsteadi]|uniref:hypothetical protein n=2 Tax=Rickettsieae TaxID=33988 RepID=UPI000B9A5F23|nr:hypothetical protein [Rickettsia endosymbiont of Culicoides newsteadi]OZG31559.1 hypothetical protein RiCNE_10520 [Rickettsia endosymbiont of Culicoides newsteadi]